MAALSESYGAGQISNRGPMASSGIQPVRCEAHRTKLGHHQGRDRAVQKVAPGPDQALRSYNDEPREILSRRSIVRLRFIGREPETLAGETSRRG